MKKITFFLKQILIVGICALLFSCSQAGKGQSLNSEVKAGVAKLSGKFVDYKQEGDEPQSVYVTVYHPLTDDFKKIETTVSEDGSFVAEIPVELNVNVGYVYSEVYNLYAIASLMPDRETKIEVTYDEATPDQYKITSNHELFSDNFRHASSIFREMHMLHPELKFKDLTRADVERFIADPKEYIPRVMKYNWGQRLEVAEKDSIMTEKEKSFIINDVKLAFSSELWAFTDVMSEYYQVTGEKGDTTSITVAEPDKSYYIFMKEFDLNNPQYLYCEDYNRALNATLKNKTLNIPPIGDIPIDKWLKEVKVILADLVGFDSGIFYDMLAVNAYTRQLNKELKPLTEKQAANISRYFKGGDVAKILLEKNEYITKIDNEGQRTVVNETPAVPKEELMDAIVSKYRGKVVIVDFWATWCGPCMDAMKSTLEVKSAMHDKDVVFVYVTGVTSPEKKWSEEIKAIRGEHYYLTKEEWKYMFEQFKFEGIPTYLFFDKNGELKRNQTSFMGVETMKEWIEELL